MKRKIALALAVASCSWQVTIGSAQDTDKTTRQDRQEERQEARQEAQSKRQEARQETREEARQERAEQTRDDRQESRQENRQDRREQRQARMQQRLDNRSQYYDTEALSELDPWIKRNNVAPLDRVSRVAGAAVKATERALNTATNAANKIDANTDDQSRYGYLNKSGGGDAGWFYDYYSYSPTYYNAPATGSTIYGSATRYYDLNGDGVYDNLNVFRDSDNNASYDVYDRYDFDEADDKQNSQSVEELADSPEDANRHTVAGKIYATKSAKVNGVESLIVRLSDTTQKDAGQQESDKKDSDKKETVTIVDVGPLQAWKERSYKSGDPLTATGPVERVGDKQVLIAETITLGDQKEIQIVRGAPKIEGQVVDVTKTKVKGAQHTIAVIESESKRQLVDLGPADQLKVNIEPQTTIAVRGVPVRAGTHSIVQAEQLVVDAKDVQITRWQKAQSK